jgi:Fe(3+) dicitrate transport protein
MDISLQRLIVPLFCIILSLLHASAAEVNVKTYTVQCTVINSRTKKGISSATIFAKQSALSLRTDSLGRVILQHRGAQPILYTFSAKGYFERKVRLSARSDTNFTIVLVPDSYEGKEIVVEADRSDGATEFHMPSISDVTIYESKKSEQILLEELPINRASNTARQIYSRVAGINVWENDGSGVQLNIGARGLSPNRTSNFNTRQNGYDISADALGYPESYYTPPAEALEKIEVIRGASSLQYGTQFGGMLNFSIHKPTLADTTLTIESLQSAGSFGMLSTFNSINTRYKSIGIYGYYQSKKGNGWRPNSKYSLQNIYVASDISVTDNIVLGFDYTRMDYLAKQPGGLSDADFARNPQQSLRARNWFEVQWNVFSARIDARLHHDIKIKSQFFGLIAERGALGNLERITVADLGQNRQLLFDEYANWGNETRIIVQHDFVGVPSSLAMGFRVYSGTTVRKQGDGSADSSANFTFLSPNKLEVSDFRFPNTNNAFFVENIFNLSDNFSITPGLRYEYIATRAQGYYSQITRDFAGNIVADTMIRESLEKPRQFVLFGIGASWRPSEALEIYSNISQNYRSVTFSDIRVANPNIVVDTNLQDERGYNIDIGFRGIPVQGIYCDISVFYLGYNNRIGLLQKADAPPLYLPYRFRTNIASSFTAGIESYTMVQYARLLNYSFPVDLSTFFNIGYQYGIYSQAASDKSIAGKEVELVPPLTMRIGATIGYGDLSATVLYSFTDRHFSDATNAERSSTAVIGIIPAYSIVDISARWHYGIFIIEGGINNILDNLYFTRRADGYPGPGIIPADPRTFYATVGVKHTL